jgi:hypothetical protein
VDLSVSRSQSDGRDVLCVSDARTEQEAGRYDRRSGRLVVADQARVYEVVQALWDFLAVAGGEGGADRVCPPCAGDSRPEALDISAAPAVPEALDAPDARDVLGTAEDFEAFDPPDAAGRPWDPSYAPYAAAPASAGGSWGRGGRLVDRRLGRLRRDGWAVLSPGGGWVGAEFDRLVIGPPGVFAITFTHGGDPPVDGQPAARMLSAASGMAIKVTPVLAFVGPGADGADAYAPPGRDGESGGVLIARGEDIAEVLWALPAVYSIQERKRIFDIARRPEMWRAAAPVVPAA